MKPRVFAFASALIVGACSSGYFADQDEYCRRRPDAPSCDALAGASGSAGASGVGGAGAAPGGAAGNAGTGGAAGLGGGGAGGQGPCASDSACAADEGAGSLCVASVCTAPTASCTKGTLVVVPDEAFVGSIDGELATACHYRALGPALTAAATNGSATTGVVVYATSVEGPAVVPVGVRLEGRPTAPATLVVLTTSGAGGAAGASGGAGAAGGGGAGPAALVTLGDGAALAGFALDAAGVVGVRVATGKASLEGPLELRGGAPALSVEGTAAATVTGKAEAPVLFTENKRGVVVSATAALEMTGEGGTGLVVEKTSAGVGVLVDTGTGSDVPTKLVSVAFRENRLGSGTDGIGGIEVRRNRQVLVQGCTFVQNQQSVTLNAQATPSANLFLGVKLSGNDFSGALPAPGQGAAVCGSKLAIAGTEIHVEPLANTFPVAGAACSTIAPAFGCTDGVDVGYDTPSTAPTLVCPSGTL